MSRLRLQDAKPIVEQLIEMGYLRFVPADQVENAKESLIEAAVCASLDCARDRNGVSFDKRNYPADSEELAEGRLGEFLLKLNDVLRAEGVELQSVKDDFQNDYYVVLINDRAYPIYHSEDWKSKNCWNVAHRRMLEIANELLQQAGSSERLYAVSGGNEGRVILLTPDMFAYIHSLPPAFSRHWLPFSSTDFDD